MMLVFGGTIIFNTLVMKKLVSISFICLFLGLSLLLNGQSGQMKEEAILCKKKWTIVNTKKRKHDFEIGEQFSFTIDKKFILTRNDYTSIGGTWKIVGGDELILLFNTNKEGENRKIPSIHKIVKLNEEQLILKYLYEEGKGKDKVKVKAKIYLQ